RAETSRCWLNLQTAERKRRKSTRKTQKIFLRFLLRFWVSFFAPFAFGIQEASRIVTNSSAAVGWLPIVASKIAFVAPAFIASASAIGVSCMRAVTSPIAWIDATFVV